MILDNEIFIRLGFFFGVLAIMCTLEVLYPFRQLRMKRSSRWPNNMGIVVLNTVLLKFIFPITAVGFASFIQVQGWGLFNVIELPEVAEVLFAFVLLDFGIYLQHLAFHNIPALWRMHRMHHTDTDFDVTTGARFHPLEIILSMLIKFWMILALGPAPLAVFIFEVVLNATAMFNHSNITLPKGLDRVLRFILVTPDMHRVHHSVIVRETNSNFGFNLPWWDRMFQTYIEAPKDDPKTMPIGIESFRDESEAGIKNLLTQPFR